MPISAGFLIEVDGTPLPDDIAAMMVSAVVDDSLRLPDLFILRFRDPQRIVIAKGKFKVGAALKVSVMTADGKSPELLITGDVTAMEVEFDPTGTFTVIRGYDKAHLLFRGRRTQTYTQSTASDVVKQVATRAGLKAGKIESTTTVFDHLSQGGVTDWEFLEGLAGEIGYEISVKDGALDFKKPGKASEAPTGDSAENPLILVPGTDLIRFRSVVTSAEQVKEVEVRGWDVAQKLALVATEPAESTTIVLPTVTPAQMAQAFGNPTYVATDVPYRSQAEVDGAAKALAAEIAGAFAQFEGVARGNPKLHANASITIDGVGEPFDGKYVITTSQHRYQPSTGYTTSFAVTGRQERSLYGLASGGSSSGKAGYGPVVALVSDSNDPEMLGRVKLTFPWLSDDYVSDWARTVFPGAGKKRGFTNLPEVGDEVLVLFEQGDISRPYVMGGLFNGIDQPETHGVKQIDGSSGAVNRRSWVSRNGHRIDLLDEDGRSEGISLTSAGDTVQLKMDSVDTKITIHSDGKILVEGKGGVIIDAGTAKLELKAGEVSIDATTGVKINGGSGAVDVSTSGNLTLKGTTAKLEGSAQVEVKGGAMAVLGAPLVKIN